MRPAARGAAEAAGLRAAARCTSAGRSPGPWRCRCGRPPAPRRCGRTVSARRRPGPRVGQTRPGAAAAWVGGGEGGQMEEGRGGDAAEPSGVGSFCSAASECGPDFLGPDRDLGQATQAASSSGQRGPSRLALGGWTPVRAPRTASCSRAPGSARSPAPRAWVRGGRRPGCRVRGARGSRRSRGRPSST